VTVFARTVFESPAAEPQRGDRSGPLGRRVARVAADTALDALKRIFLNGQDYAGLRGGGVHVEFDDGFVVTLDRARWTRDAAVSGTIRWTFDGGRLEGDLRVDGPRSGTLRLDGGRLIPGAPRTLLIGGKLGDRNVAADVPSA
jgi:hypothetical protein